MTRKIAVYTIALNELQHCERWANSVADADYRIVLDTGSTDGTVEKLRELGVTVHVQRISPWRFDVARNAALTMVPVDADICVSMDMDEFMETGWRAKVEAAWTDNTTRLAYTYVFDHKQEGPNDGFYSDKIHARDGYEWRRPVHETVYANLPREVVANDPSIIMNQIQDRTKTTRSNYLPLLKMAHDEDRNDSQIAFWYGRELMYKGESAEAAVVLKRYLELPTSTWNAEKSEALIYLSRLEPDNGWAHLNEASVIAPTRREVWLEIANHCYAKQDWVNLLWASLNGLARSHNQGSYLDRLDSWGPQLADLGSLAAYHLGWVNKAVELVKAALLLDPNNDRLKSNLQFMQKAKENQP